jgi:Kelch motif
MRQARSTFSLVRVEDVLYAIGGYSDKPEASVEAYDVIGDKWYANTFYCTPKYAT